MKTVRRLLYRDIAASVAFVAMAFLSLFYFIDFVDDLDQVGQRGRTIWDVALGALYEVPGHCYELLPIAVLIGTIYSLARMAQSSEYTILRTGGLGPGRALRMLAGLGLAFGVANFVVGDYVAPAAEQAAVRLKAQFAGSLRIGGGGAWLKERRSTPAGSRSYSINIGGTTADGQLEDVRAYEFDDEGRLLARIAAPRARVAADGTWTLSDLTITHWPLPGAGPDARVQVAQVPSLQVPTRLDPGVVASAVLPLATMTTLDLWRYSGHLQSHEQAAQQVQILFWKRALYPISCLVMVGLALPFAYLHARAGSLSLKVFGGIMLGISFVLLDNLAGHLGLLRDWTPWVVAAAPSLLYLLMSMAAFGWLVRYR